MHRQGSVNGEGEASASVPDDACDPLERPIELGVHDEVTWEAFRVCLLGLSLAS